MDSFPTGFMIPLFAGVSFGLALFVMGGLLRSVLVLVVRLLNPRL